MTHTTLQHKTSLLRQTVASYRWTCLLLMLAEQTFLARAVEAPSLPLVQEVDVQPLAAQVRHVTDTLKYLGAPLSATERATLEAAMAKGDAADATEQMQQILDPHCLVSVEINPEMRIKV